MLIDLGSGRLTGSNCFSNQLPRNLALQHLVLQHLLFDLQNTLGFPNRRIFFGFGCKRFERATRSLLMLCFN